ncbi:MAG: Plug domain-containing protein, partial [Bergeyella zoohelcum]|nr:Plug domain-containing protein [Bergeyella zoohelcum]
MKKISISLLALAGIVAMESCSTQQKITKTEEVKVTEMKKAENKVRHYDEKGIALRGFDARQTPLFIDGIPVYVPYDGYVDFNRFTTADLAAIEVSK